MIPDLTINLDRRERTSFHASDFGKMACDIYYDWKKTPQTNPTPWNATLKWGAGKGVELQMLKVLKDSGIVAADFDQDKAPELTIGREGIEVKCHVDAIVTEGAHELVAGAPIEIKSINNKNAMDIKRYLDAKPRENYVGQLATYMDALQKEVGYLFVASVDGLSYFWFECRALGDGKYQCGNTIVDLGAEYKRYKEIYDAHIMKNIEPDPFEKGRYKIPLDEIDWKALSVSDISKARNGEKVIGDPEAWYVLYSPWKDLIISRQGATLGYGMDELARIREVTKGYSSKKLTAKETADEAPHKDTN